MKANKVFVLGAQLERNALPVREQQLVHLVQILCVYKPLVKSRDVRLDFALESVIVYMTVKAVFIPKNRRVVAFRFKEKIPVVLANVCGTGVDIIATKSV